MALIVENGSQVANANSYNTLVELRAYASARGVTLSATDSIVEIQAVKALDFFESHADRFKGSKVSATQALQFPRINLSVDGFSIAQDAIHPLVKACQCQLVIDLQNGIDISPNASGEKILIREKIDVIENEWQPGSASGQPKLTAFENLVSRLLQVSTGGLTVRRA